MIITFIGHSVLENHDAIKEKVALTLKDYISPTQKTHFYCGGYGDFDELCASVCRQLKKDCSNIEIIYVSPYISISHQKKIKCLINEKLYDSVIYPPLEDVPPKFAISKRNEWMIQNADIVISHVKHTYGGAYKTLQFAKRQKKNIIDL